MENHCIIYPSWPVHGFEARQSAALSFSPDIYSARQSGPINFPDYIEPIVTRPTSTARWIYPQGCSSSSSTSPPLSPYLNLIFPQSALKALFLQKDTSFLSLFRLFLPSSNLFPLIHFEKKFSCFDPHPFFLIFLSDVGEEILLFRIPLLEAISQSSWPSSGI